MIVLRSDRQHAELESRRIAGSRDFLFNLRNRLHIALLSCVCLNCKSHNKTLADMECDVACEWSGYVGSSVVSAKTCRRLCLTLSRVRLITYCVVSH